MYLKGQKQKKDQEKGQTMEDISRMVTELNSKIEAKREIIEPLLNRVRYIYEILHLLKYIRDACMITPKLIKMVINAITMI